MKKVLLVGQDQTLLSALYEKLYPDFQVHVCDRCDEIVNDFLSFLPDLLIWELEAPGCDTVGLFRAVRAQEGQTMGIIITDGDLRYANDFISQFPHLFLMTGPVDAEQVISNIKLIEQQLSMCAPRYLPIALEGILQQLGFRCGSIGFSCLREGIIYRYHNPDCLYTDDLYPYVAKRCNGSAQSVVKVMSRSIQTAWRNRNPVLWAFLFPDNTQPTCAAFINTMAQWLHNMQ